jgi:RNase H-fold protein (predicted Holliday junction resolvase)
MIILAIDPGTSKCGLAVLTRTSCIHREITKTDNLVNCVKSLKEKYKFELIIIGNGTNCKACILELEKNYKLIMVDERNSTLEGRKLYFKYNPPRGWRRLIPKGLLYPNVDIDDYVAEIIGKKFFKENQ